MINSMTHLAARRLRLLLLPLAVILLSACATPEKPRGILRYGMEDAPEGRLVYFPPPPEVPRFIYAGALVGEENFVYPKPQRGAWEKAFYWLTGLDEPQMEVRELQRPQAVAVDADGRVFVTDVGQRAVVVFDPVAGELRILRQSDGLTSFIMPTGLAIGDGGEVLVTDSEAGQVARLDANGNTRPPIGKGVLVRPTGIAYDRQRQRIFVADTDASDIKVFDRQGRLLETIGGHGAEPGEFNRPTYLAIAHNSLYVSDTMNARVQVLDLESGAYLRTIGMRGLYVGQLARPKGVAVDGEGRVYVVESFHDHLLIYDAEGNLLLPIGGTGYASDNFYLPAGLWVDGGGRVYVADMFNGRVVTYLFLGGEAESD